MLSQRTIRDLLQTAVINWNQSPEQLLNFHDQVKLIPQCDRLKAGTPTLDEGAVIA